MNPDHQNTNETSAAAGGSDYGRAVMDRNAAEELAREAYANGDMKLRDEMLAEYRAAKERVKLYEPNEQPS